MSELMSKSNLKHHNEALNEALKEELILEIADNFAVIIALCSVYKL